jgi:hypothetical protein
MENFEITGMYIYRRAEPAPRQAAHETTPEVVQPKSSQAEEGTMSKCRMSALPVAAMLVTLLAGSAAQAACDENNFKDCAGKPWMTGKPDTPIGEAWWPKSYGAPTTRLARPTGSPSPRW